ncbi:hypothetical protein BCR32DRAFT_295657 [Anaeromyces robustus]|uniref:Uncharacterized protein n=1 Tax=Anaeromyces robustus TaxID=1754192 RepID=A0A1Y1WUY9_9FUNG|nr:hypothetical protein BCR32DRAFT_295657 [Anaeromyces robustus]|eukprot:ORX77371.1 hypothetical protein BCR32DRAFT_295657 [Anaeromyces robustus]
MEINSWKSCSSPYDSLNNDINTNNTYKDNNNAYDTYEISNNNNVNENYTTNNNYDNNDDSISTYRKNSRGRRKSVIFKDEVDEVPNDDTSFSLTLERNFNKNFSNNSKYESILQSSPPSQFNNGVNSYDPSPINININVNDNERPILLNSNTPNRGNGRRGSILKTSVNHEKIVYNNNDTYFYVDNNPQQRMKEENLINDNNNNINDNNDNYNKNITDINDDFKDNIDNNTNNNNNKDNDNNYDNDTDNNNDNDDKGDDSNSNNDNNNNDNNNNDNNNYDNDNDATFNSSFSDIPIETLNDFNTDESELINDLPNTSTELINNMKFKNDITQSPFLSFNNLSWNDNNSFISNNTYSRQYTNDNNNNKYNNYNYNNNNNHETQYNNKIPLSNILDQNIKYYQDVNGPYYDENFMTPIRKIGNKNLENIAPVKHIRYPEENYHHKESYQDEDITERTPNGFAIHKGLQLASKQIYNNQTRKPNAEALEKQWRQLDIKSKKFYNLREKQREERFKKMLHKKITNSISIPQKNTKIIHQNEYNNDNENQDQLEIMKNFKNLSIKKFPQPHKNDILIIDPRIIEKLNNKSRIIPTQNELNKRSINKFNDKSLDIKPLSSSYVLKSINSNNNNYNNNNNGNKNDYKNNKNNKNNKDNKDKSKKFTSYENLITNKQLSLASHNNNNTTPSFSLPNLYLTENINSNSDYSLDNPLQQNSPPHPHSPPPKPPSLLHDKFDQFSFLQDKDELSSNEKLKNENSPPSFSSSSPSPSPSPSPSSSSPPFTNSTTTTTTTTNSNSNPTITKTTKAKTTTPPNNNNNNNNINKSLKSFIPVPSKSYLSTNTLDSLNLINSSKSIHSSDSSNIPNPYNLPYSPHSQTSTTTTTTTTTTKETNDNINDNNYNNDNDNDNDDDNDDDDIESNIISIDSNEINNNLDNNNININSTIFKGKHRLNLKKAISEPFIKSITKKKFNEKVKNIDFKTPVQNSTNYYIQNNWQELKENKLNFKKLEKSIKERLITEVKPTGRETFINTIIKENTEKPAYYYKNYLTETFGKDRQHLVQNHIDQLKQKLNNNNNNNNNNNQNPLTFSTTIHGIKIDIDANGDVNTLQTKKAVKSINHRIANRVTTIQPFENQYKNLISLQDPPPHSSDTIKLNNNSNNNNNISGISYIPRAKKVVNKNWLASLEIKPPSIEEINDLEEYKEVEIITKSNLTLKNNPLEKTYFTNYVTPDGHTYYQENNPDHPIPSYSSLLLNLMNAKQFLYLQLPKPLDISEINPFSETINDFLQKT